MKDKFIIAIDLGGTNLKLGVLDPRYRILRKEALSTKGFKKKEGLISGISCSVNKIRERSHINKKDILGVGLGLPGPVDKESGLVHFLPNIAGFSNVNLRAILEKKLGLPVFIDNDAKAMAQAEYRFGRAKRFKNVLCVTLGTGVGGGIILLGELYRGRDNAGGEIGHIPINEKGPRCNCGGYGCLESYVGNSRILKEARTLFKRAISLEELSALAKKQNRLALEIWRRVGERLGIALAGAVNLLNLDAIVIGGGVANAGPILFDKLRETLKLRAMSVQARRVKIYKAKLGVDAGIIGAAMLVKQEPLPTLPTTFPPPSHLPSHLRGATRGVTLSHLVGGKVGGKVVGRWSLS